MPRQLLFQQPPGKPVVVDCGLQVPRQQPQPRVLYAPVPLLSQADLDRFWSKVRPGPRGCLLWTASLNTYGYGSFAVGHIDGQRRRNFGAHRLAYRFYVGEIAIDRQIDHLCRNRRCVNPLHLEAVTSRENTMRGVGVSATNARKTHCRHGHAYTPDNLVSEGHGKGWRSCRTCKIRRARESRARAVHQ